MSTLFLLAIFVVSAVATQLVVNLSLRYLRLRTKDQKNKLAELDSFYDFSAKFLRETNDKDQPLVRISIACMPNNLTNGSLARHVILNARNGGSKSRKSQDSDFKRKVRGEIKSMPDAALSAFEKAIYHAIIASSFDLPLMGRVLRSGIRLTSDANSPHVEKPEQIVYRTQDSRRRRPVTECATV